jgi:AAA+ ATPase superfamily predicted ATPase
MFVGRKRELKILEEAYRSRKSELTVIYGRRRIGKSSLINIFSQNKPDCFKFEAIEGEPTQVQIRHFTAQLRKQCNADSVRFGCCLHAEESGQVKSALR